MQILRLLACRRGKWNAKQQQADAQVRSPAFAYLFLQLVCLSAYLPACPPAFLSVCPFVCLSVCLSQCVRVVGSLRVSVSLFLCVFVFVKVPYWLVVFKEHQN